MKKTILFSAIIIFLLSACETTSVLPKIPRKELLTGIDFSKYTKNGFLITPEKYNGNYESIGLITFVFMPEATPKTNTIENNYSWKEGADLVTGYSWDIEKVNIQDAIDAMYKRCTEMGANALVNFNASEEIAEYIFAKAPLKIKGYRITGFAIKIK